MNLRRVPKWVWAVLAVALVGGWWLLRDPAPKVEYKTAAIERGDIVTSISASGKIQAVNTVEVGSQLSGQVTALYADFNTPVKKGQVIARIDPSTFAAREQQTAAQSAASAAQVAQAQAALTEARRDLSAKSALVSNGFVSKRTIETAQASVAQASAQLASARASVAQNQAALAATRLDVGRTYIRAPVTGTIIDRSINLGQTVAASLQAPKLFVIAEDLSRMQVEAAVDEADIGRVKKGQSVDFTVDAYPDDTFKGTVSEVRIAGVEVSNVVTYTVIITAANPDSKLLPGMTANANIILGEVRNVLKLPVAALRYTPASEQSSGSPAAAAQAASSNPLGGGGVGPGMFRRMGRPDPSAMVDRMTDGLDISADQRKSITDIVEASMKQMGGGGGGGDRSARQKARAAMRTQIAAVLTPEQRTKFEAMQGGGGRGGAGGAKSGTVWVLDTDGKPQRRFVRTTTGDDEFAAVRGGQLKAGDKVVTGEIVPDEDAAK